MAKPNYRHAKKQKEAARKARQDAKQQRRAQPAEIGESGLAHAHEPPAAAAPVKTGD